MNNRNEIRYCINLFKDNWLIVKEDNLYADISYFDKDNVYVNKLIFLLKDNSLTDFITWIELDNNAHTLHNKIKEVINQVSLC